MTTTTQSPRQAPARRLSLAERDRRHSLVRELAAEAEVGAIIGSGHNAFYLTNGVPGENYALLSVDPSEPLTTYINGRHIADIPVQVLYDAQEWNTDIRPASDFIHSPRQQGDTSEVVKRLVELGLGENARVGVDAGFSALVIEQLREQLPKVEFVQAADAFVNARTVKSDEELDLIEEAARIWDAAVDVIRENVRPGMLGREVVAAGIRAMWEQGADQDARFFLSFGKHASQNPAIAELGLTKEIQAGDMLTLTSMARYAGYTGHTDQLISVGEPSNLHADMFEAILGVREHVLSKVKPGILHSDLAAAYKEAAQLTSFRFSNHSQIHQFGIDAPEYPGSRFRVKKEFVPGQQEQPDFVLAAGMVYSISPTLISLDGKDVLLAGTDLAVTADGYRDLQHAPVRLLVA